MLRLPSVRLSPLACGLSIVYTAILFVMGLIEMFNDQSLEPPLFTGLEMRILFFCVYNISLWGEQILLGIALLIIASRMDSDGLQTHFFYLGVIVLCLTFVLYVMIYAILPIDLSGPFLLVLIMLQILILYRTPAVNSILAKFKIFALLGIIGDTASSLIIQPLLREESSGIGYLVSSLLHVLTVIALYFLSKIEVNPRL